MTAAEPRYAHGHQESVLRSHRWRTAENSAAYLLPHLRDGAHVLDVGSGPGTITVDFARRLPHGRVVAIDSAPAAVSATRAAATSAGVANVDAAVADVMHLDFPDGTFDVVHAHQVLQHLADPVGALREMRRVCAPGGVVAVREADYDAMTWHPASSGLDQWLSLYRQLARHLGGEPDAGRRLREWAVAAGFAEVSASASVWCFADEADLAWWTQTWADRVVDSSFARHATEAGLADDAQLATLAEAWRAWGNDHAAWFCIVHGEALCRG